MAKRPRKGFTDTTDEAKKIENLAKSISKDKEVKSKIKGNHRMTIDIPSDLFEQMEIEKAETGTTMRFIIIKMLKDRYGI